jgi:hypothetical protein
VVTENLGDKYLLATDGVWADIERPHGPKFPGIYRLHVLDDHGEFLPLPRLLGEDAHGIVYIGTSKFVPIRLGELRKSIAAAYWKVDARTYAHLLYRDEMQHPTGKKIMRIPRFVERFPFGRLCLTMERYTGAEEALDMDLENYGHTELEARLLRDYERQYGEKPALNS